MREGYLGAEPPEVNPQHPESSLTLNAQQQSDLAIRAKASDQRATAKLIKFCDRDILAIVNKVKCSAADRDDLIQEARIVVLKAIQKFDPSAGKQFRYYTAEWVREEVRRAANTLSSVVVRNVRTRGTDVSLDEPTGDKRGGGEQTLFDVIPSEEQGPEASAVESNNAEQVRQAMENIVRQLARKASARYDRAGLCRDLVYNRLLSERPLKLDVFAKRWSVARQTVSNLETYILTRAQRALEA